MSGRGEQPGYPREWEADVVAADGAVVHLRPIRPSDAEAVVAFHARLSDRTRYLRYFGAYPNIPPRDLERFTVVDHRDRVAFVALLGGAIIAIGRYIRLGDGPSAEVAFVVRDDHQGRGLGSILLEHLAAAAAENGVRRFEAEVLAENHQMVRVFRDAGYEVSRHLDQGVLHLEFDVDPTETSVAVRNAREQAAEARGVHTVLHPRSVAVIGASTDRSKIGHAVFAHLLAGEFTGPVYPVHPTARSVRGVRAYRSVADIPDPVDLAVIAVPAAGVPAVLRACLAAGVRALVLLSGGFAADHGTVAGISTRVGAGVPNGDPPGGGHDAPGPEGRGGGAGGVWSEPRLVELVRAGGARLIGPSALGVLNTDPGVSLNATLAPRLPARGRIGFFCQSGALGVAILGGLTGRGLGLSTFVSAGDRADLSGNDLLQYWQTDPATEVVLLYLETFGNPRKFARLARRLAREKPVVAVKSGRGLAARPGLGRGPAGPEPEDGAGVQTLFEQTGVIRVQTLPQMFDIAQLLAYQPLPAGPRVAVVGNSAALGLLVTDAVLDEGLRPAGPPVDVGVTAPPEAFGAAVAAAVADDEVDALIAVFVPPVAIPVSEYARTLRVAGAGLGKPVLSTFLAAEGVPPELAVAGPDGRPGPGSVPSYPSPERAVASLARAWSYARWRATPPGEYRRPDGIDPERARGLVDRLFPGGGPPVPLADADTVALLACYGVDLVPFRVVASVAAALDAAGALGFPVTLKGVGERWQGPELIGIRLDLGTADAVAAAYADLAEITGQDTLIVQRMAPKGPSCRLEVVDDPSFGSLLAFGLSGIATELLGDRAHRVVPLSTADARELVRAPRAAPLLTGYRGAPPADLAGLEDLALRISALAEDVPEVRSLRLGPVLAAPDTVSVTAARVVLGAQPDRRDGGPRRLG